MIAANFRKYPQAAALQLVLNFGRPVWNTTRPTTRTGRALRQAQAAAVKATPQVVAWVKVRTPEWFKAAKARARDLAAKVREAMLPMVWELLNIGDNTPARIRELVKKYHEAHKGYESFRKYTASWLVGAIEWETALWVNIRTARTLFGATDRARKEPQD